jgi:hypothetical protein
MVRWTIILCLLVPIYLMLIALFTFSEPISKMRFTKLDFGQKFNGLAMVRGAKYGVREFLYCHGQAGTVKKFTGVSVYPANYAPPRAAKIGQSQA